jgi:pimeloyl-ACP methyl ester carboxylesterase
VEDAHEAIAQRVEDRLVLYGHSLGAMVAAAAAARWPERIAAVILEDPPFSTMGSRIGEGPLLDYFRKYSRYASHGRPVTEVARELADLRYGPPGAEDSLRLGDRRDAAALRFTARALADVDPEVFVPILEGRWLEQYHLEDIARRVNCPVLLLQADSTAGGMLRDEDVELWRSATPDVTVVRFAGVGHQIRWSAPGRLLGAVWSFLGSL